MIAIWSDTSLGLEILTLNIEPFAT